MLVSPHFEHADDENSSRHNATTSPLLKLLGELRNNVYSHFFLNTRIHLRESMKEDGAPFKIKQFQLLAYRDYYSVQ